MRSRTASPAKFAEWLADQDDAVFHRIMNYVGVNNGTSLQNSITLTFGTYTVNGESVTGYGAANLPSGYYLVRNTTVPEGQTFSDYIVFVLTDDTVADPKSAPSPTPEKKVTDKNDSTPNSVEANATQDSADYEIGDSIPYTLKVQLPTNYANYTEYKLVFTDQMSMGLTFNNDAKIFFGAGDTSGTPINFEQSGGSALYPSEGKTYTYTIDNLKTPTYAGYNLQGGDTIRITYTATLNSSAVVGAEGNPNAFTIEYSNNPTGNTTGISEPDVTTVFTFKLVFNKVDSKDNPLSGADFTLCKWIADDSAQGGSWVDVTTLGSGDNRPGKIVSDDGSISNCIFTFKGLDDGKYKLVESTTPTGYNTIDDIEFDVTASHERNSAAPLLTGLTGANTETSFTMTADVNGGQLSANIVNESGSVLPTTGAGGTVLLMTLGTLVAVAGFVVLVTRRRLLAE